jgi:chemotaxis signal transduction protein
VSYVDEVFDMVAVMALSEKKAGVVGLIDYHGELIALCDLNEICGLGPAEISQDNLIVICSAHQYRFGLMVSETFDVVNVKPDGIKTADGVTSGVLREIGLIRVAGETVAVIDLWSAILSVQLNDLPKEAPGDLPRDGDREEREA